MLQIFYFGLGSCYWNDRTDTTREKVFDQQFLSILKAIALTNKDIQITLYLVDPAFKSAKENSLTNDQLFYEPEWMNVLPDSTEAMIVYKNEKYPTIRMIVVPYSTDDKEALSIIQKEFSTFKEDKEIMLIVGQWFVTQGLPNDMYYPEASVLQMLDEYILNNQIKDRLLLLPSSLQNPIVINNQGLPRVHNDLFEIKKSQMQQYEERKKIEAKKNKIATKYSNLLFFRKDDFVKEDGVARATDINQKRYDVKFTEERAPLFNALKQKNVFAFFEKEGKKVTFRLMSEEDLKKQIEEFDPLLFR